MKRQIEAGSADVNIGSLTKYFGLLVIRKLENFLIEADVVLGDLVRGDWYCSRAVLHGRYVPCSGGRCPFHVNPVLAGIYW